MHLYHPSCGRPGSLFTEFKYCRVRVYRAGLLVPVFKQPRIRAAEVHEAFDEVENGAILSLYVCGPARTVCTQQ